MGPLTSFPGAKGPVALVAEKATLGETPSLGPSGRGSARGEYRLRLRSVGEVGCAPLFGGVCSYSLGPDLTYCISLCPLAQVGLRIEPLPFR